MQNALFMQAQSENRTVAPYEYKLHFPLDAKEVKAQWRPISVEDKSRYRWVEFSDSDGSKLLYGLTGSPYHHKGHSELALGDLRACRQSETRERTSVGNTYHRLRCRSRRLSRWNGYQGHAVGKLPTPRDTSGLCPIPSASQRY